MDPWYVVFYISTEKAKVGYRSQLSFVYIIVCSQALQFLYYQLWWNRIILVYWIRRM